MSLVAALKKKKILFCWNEMQIQCLLLLLMMMELEHNNNVNTQMNSYVHEQHEENKWRLTFIQAKVSNFFFVLLFIFMVLIARSLTHFFFFFFCIVDCFPLKDIDRRHKKKTKKRSKERMKEKKNKTYYKSK